MNIKTLSRIPKLSRCLRLKRYMYFMISGYELKFKWYRLIKE